MSTSGRIQIALLGLLMFLFGTGFKTSTHIASANKALEELQTQINPNTSGPDSLKFTVNGVDLVVPVSSKEAFKAVMDHREFFRGGTIGPDGFADLVSGQMFQHGNGAPSLQSMVQGTTGGAITPEPLQDIVPPVPLEERFRVSQYRSIDYAMLMLELFQGEKALMDIELPPPFADVHLGFKDVQERDQALAFILGYIGHCVGDAFAHTWVNQVTGQAWDMDLGAGIFGPLTEEWQHTVTEGWIDSHVPGGLENADGSENGQFGLFAIRAPERFITKFFSAHSKVPPVQYVACGPFDASDLVRWVSCNIGLVEEQDTQFGDPDSSDFNEWAKYYSNVDQFNGGPVYNYFNAQVSLGKSAENFAYIQEVVEFTSGLPELPQTLEDILTIMDMPADVMNDIADWTSGDLLNFLSFGTLDCSIFPTPEAFQTFIALWNFLATFDERIDGYTEKAVVARANWLKLNECTSENIAKIKGPDFDPAHPDLSRDACTVLAEKAEAGIWQDNDPTGDGLVRGNVTDQAFLNQFIKHFRGDFKPTVAKLAEAIGSKYNESAGTNNPELAMLIKLLGTATEYHGFEPNSHHRSMVDNVIRLQDYLMGPGFLLDDFRETLMGTLVGDLFKEVCETVRNPAERNCLNLALKGAAVAWESAGLGKCGVEYAACRGAGLTECQFAACTIGCDAVTFMQATGACDDICELTTETACEAAVDTFCPTICLAPGCEIPSPYGGTECIPTGVPACELLGAECCFGGLGVDPLGCGDAKKSMCEVKDEDDCGDFFTSLGCEKDLVTHCTENAVSFVDNLFTKFDYGDAIFDKLEQICDIVEEPVDQFAQFVVDNDEKIYTEVKKNAPMLATVGFGGMFFAAIYDQWSDVSEDEKLNAAFVNEDVVNDPVYKATLRQRAVNAIAARTPPTAPDDPITVAGLNAFIQALDNNAPFAIQITGAPAGATWPQIQAAAAANADEMAKMRGLLRSGIFAGIQGPTLAFANNAMGDDMPETFTPFFNVVHGLELIPFQTSDIEAMFATTGVSTSLLPWVLGANSPYSALCNNPATANIYCDALISNDDPDCRNCESDLIFNPLAPNPGPDWVIGHGLIPWDTEEVNPTVNTVFPLSTTPDAYEKLYQRIFRTPDDKQIKRVKNLFEFEEDDGWHVDNGSGDVSIDKGVKSSGNGSLEVEGCNFNSIHSRRFNTTDLEKISHQLTVDVFKPSSAALPWYGTLQLFISIPAANINSQMLGQQDLATLAAGTWSPVNFAIPENVFQALASDYPGVVLDFRINTPCATMSDGYHLDNLRFTGTLVDTADHDTGAANPDVRTNDLFGFENSNEWSIPAGTVGSSSPERRNVTQGLASLRVSGQGWVPVNSIPFNTQALIGSNVRPFLSVDVFVPDPQPEWYWVGDVRVELTCGANTQTLGQPVPLTHFFEGEFNAAIFQIPAAGLALLSGNNTCVIRPVLNITGGPSSGGFLLDNMGFIDDPGDCRIGPACTCNDGVQNAGEGGVDCGGQCATACATCSDGIPNQGETGVDCGGPCGACPTCSDGIQNQGETGVDCGGPCTACAAGCTAVTYQAETMTHSTGGAITGGWNIWSNGYIAQNHTFTAGSRSIVVTARGSVAAGVWPHMVVSVGGTQIGQATVNTTTYTTYTFNFTATAGTKEIRVAFDNDGQNGSEDRNLYVDQVVAGCGSGGGGGGSCTAATATDLGAPGTDTVVPVGGCVRVQNGYPTWWGTRVMRLENTTTTGSYPVPFTWTNSCTSSSGSGSYTANFQSKTFTTTSSACPTVIDLTSTGTGNITLRYWSN